MIRLRFKDTAFECDTAQESANLWLALTRLPKTAATTDAVLTQELTQERDAPAEILKQDDARECV